MITEHQSVIGGKIHSIIEESEDTQSFIDSIEELKNSDSANEDKEAYEKSISKLVGKNQIDIPLRECKRALDSLGNVNVKPLINAQSEIAEGKLAEIKDVLKELEDKVKILIAEINNSNA